MGTPPQLLEHENMDDNTTSEDMNEHEPHDPQDEILDATDEPSDGATDGAGDELLAAAAALDDPAETVDAPPMDAAPEPETVWAQDDIHGTTTQEEPAATIPPPYVPDTEADRLVRDPNATLGGVASGIAHRYGFEVALTRLAFILMILFSGGTAILGYLLAWIVIPRATYWPPIARPSNAPRPVSPMPSSRVEKRPDRCRGVGGQYVARGITIQARR